VFEFTDEWEHRSSLLPGPGAEPRPHRITAMGGAVLDETARGVKGQGDTAVFRRRPAEKAPDDRDKVDGVRLHLVITDGVRLYKTIQYIEL